MKNKNMNLTGSNVNVRYDNFKDICDVKVTNTDIETKKIKKGTYDKNFFRGKTKK